MLAKSVEYFAAAILVKRDSPNLNLPLTAQ
jgi:hypothetical protein